MVILSVLWFFQVVAGIPIGWSRGRVMPGQLKFSKFGSNDCVRRRAAWHEAPRKDTRES